MKNVVRASGVFLVLALMALVVGACSPATPASTPGAKAAPTTATAATPVAAQDKPLSPPVKLKQGVTPIFASINLYVAVEKGFFKEQGLDVELINFDTGALMTAPLSTGELHVGSTALNVGLLNAIQRGLDIKVIADQNSATDASTNSFVIRKELADAGAVKDFPDWKGKTVSSQAQGNVSEILLDMALKKGNLTPNDVKVVLLPFDQVPIAIGNKSVDIAFSNEPYTTMGIDQGSMVRLIDVAKMDPGHQLSVIVLSPVYAKENPEAAKRWALAYVKAIRYYQQALKTKEGKADVISILSKYVSVKEPSLFERVTFPNINPDGYVNEKSISADQDWYASHGQLTSKVNLSTTIDNQYVDYAISKLGRFR